MIDAPLAWAFTAGLVATVNPCGFAMLPAYLAYFVGTEKDGATPAGRRDALGRALLTGAIVSLGFVAVFGVVGAIVSLGFRSVIDAVPWLAIAIGVVLVALGIALILGRRVAVPLPRVRYLRRERRPGSMFLFGVSYAVASLSCTLPIFLAVSAGTITRQGFAAGLAAFLAYGAGMSLVLLTLTLALAVARDTLIDRIRGARRYVTVAAGALILLAGGYIVYYWAVALASDPGRDRLSAPALEVERLAGRITTFLSAHALASGLVLAGIVLAALLAVLARSQRAHRSYTAKTRAK